MDQLVEFVMNIVDGGSIYGFLVPIYVGLLTAERVAHACLEQRVVWNNREAVSNLFLTGIFLGLGVAVGHLLPLGLMALVYENAAIIDLSSGLGDWLVAFLLYDLAWYLDHRIAHRTGVFWAMHHVHHSCPEYNMTVASRGFILDTTLLSRPMFYLLPIFGVSPAHYIMISIVTNIWGIAQHTRMVGKLGWLDLVFATPSSHRVHHGVESHYIDKNFGEVLMVWDHLFGTFQIENDEPSYGVTVPINTVNPIKIQTAGIGWLCAKIRMAPTLKLKFLVLLKPPEWEPVSETTDKARDIVFRTRSAKREFS